MSLEQGHRLMVPALPPGALPVAGQEVEPQLPPCAAPLLTAPRGPLLSQGGAGLLYFSEGGQRGSTAVWPPVSVKEICLVPEPWNSSRNHGCPGEVGAGQISVPNPPPL